MCVFIFSYDHTKCFFVSFKFLTKIKRSGFTDKKDMCSLSLWCCQTLLLSPSYWFCFLFLTGGRGLGHGVHTTDTELGKISPSCHAHTLSNKQPITWKYEERNCDTDLYLSIVFSGVCLQNNTFWLWYLLVSLITQPTGWAKLSLICLLFFIFVSSCKATAGLLNEFLLHAPFFFFFCLKTSS